MGFWDSLFGDIGALNDTGHGSDSIGKGNSDFSKDVGKETGASQRQVSESGHAARDDMAREGGWGIPSNRHKD